MNVFFPQSLQTQIELEEIACVEKQIISPTSSKTVIGIVQDGLLGSWTLTDPKLRIDWRSAMNIMSYTSMESFKNLKKNKDYTGAELFSLILPQGVNVVKGSFKIKNGQLLEGRLSKDMLGAKKKNNLIQLIWDGYGVEETKKFIDNTQRLINNFNLWHGFSVGIGDIVVPDDVHKQVEIKFQTKQLEVEKLITEIENNPDIMPPEIFEHKVFSTLNTIRDDASQLVVDNLLPNNSFGIMAWSGSKGDKTNMGQMVTCLGLQAFEGKLIPKKYNRRTFAYYFQNDDRAISRGLVRQSFIRGLEFPEYVAHLMASRLGIIEQAIKSVSGDTPIVIQENGETKSVLIGDWIDEHMKNNSDKIRHETEKQMELLKLDTKVCIPTCDKFGNTSWEELTLVTRHDPTDRMFKITTLGGREVTVADSKSLLIWNDVSNTFEPELTHLVKVGDYVPVTWNLPPPEIINKFIDMTKYLHGTDYYLEDLLTSEEIKSDRYLFAKNREHLLFEKFQLNRENGVFIGLFLANGNVDLSTGNIQFTKKNESIQKFIENYFAQMKIIYTKHVKKDKNIEETVTEIKGYSIPFGTFLTKLVGNLSENKHVPDEAFSSPNEFIIGLLDGYFSGNGTIGYSYIECKSTSFKLIDGISLLCARMGIFGKMSITQLKKYNFDTENILPIKHFSICGKWAKTFFEKISLTHDLKQEKLSKISTFEEYGIFSSAVDVVLDRIELIEELDISKYKKLYDVTVPTTTNFMSQNGLNLFDTAETGYVQRKLIKSMEDIMIKYDGTVRSANDRLIQIVYGDSGTDTTKQYEYSINLIAYNNEDVRNNCVFTKDELKSIKNFSEADNEKLYMEIIKQRDHVRRAVRNSKMNFIQEIKNFMLPVNLNRVIDNIAGTAIEGDVLTGKHIVDNIHNILLNENTTMIYMSMEYKENKNSFKRKDEIAHKQIFKLALFDALNPKRMILKLKFNKAQFDKVVTEVISSFKKNMIEPGEQAGIVAAQSTGEPLTQMTLNSVDWTTQILVRNATTNETQMLEMGKFIDDLLEQNKTNVQYLGDNLKDEMGKVQYLDTKDKQYFIPSVDENGKINWKLIEALTKHLPINKDGTHTLIKVKTRMGKEVIATKGKSFLTKKGSKLVCTRGDEIEVGSFLPTMRNFPTNVNFDETHDLTKYFPMTEYVYEFQLEIARKLKEKNNSIGIREWFTEHNSIDYTVPYSRQDSLKYVLDGQVFEIGHIYPKKCKNTTSLMPENITLDDTFGFIIGAYVAEGCCTDTQIRITNNYEPYRLKVIEFCNKYNIGYHEALQYKRLSDKPQYDIVLHSTLFAKMILDMCGKLAHNKKIPNFAFTANESFVLGLLNGYISGDGNLSGSMIKHKKEYSLSMTSVSLQLINQLSLLFTRFGIISNISHNTKIQSNNIGTLPENIHETYNLTIRNDNIKKLDKLKLVIDYKDNRLNKYFEKEYKYGSGMYDKIPDVQLNCLELLIDKNFKRTKGFIDMQNNVVHIDDLKTLHTNKFYEITAEENLEIKTMLNSDVYYDEIISIEEIEPSHEYVYDFTIADTKTFCIANTLCMYDSFHHAGIASMSATVQGVPRMKELLSVSKNPKTPQMVIYLTPEYMSNKDMAHKIGSNIKYTTLGDTRGRINVYYDPHPNSKGGHMEKDNIKNLAFQYKGSRSSCQTDINSLPWLMRIELDREKMLEKEVTLLEIKSKFCGWWEKRFNDSKVVKGEEKKVLNKINQLTILSNSDNDEQPVLHIRFNVKDGEKDKFNMGTIDNFIDLIIDKFKLKGLNSIVDIPAIQEERMLMINEDTGNEDKLTQYVIYATGVNLLDIRYFNGVDLNKTITNNIMDVYETFGIEIARAVLMKEIIGAYSNAGGEVNYQHVTMIVDQMTAMGTINSIDRHGMNKSDSDPLARASFEKTVEQLLIASVYGEIDYMRSVSSRIMAGAVVKAGTGFCEIEFDTDLVEKSEYIEGNDYSKKFTELHENTLAKDVIGRKDDDIFIPL